MISKNTIPTNSIFSNENSPINSFSLDQSKHPTDPQPNTRKKETAIVYCEGNFAKIDGKTANGLVRQSEQYEILSIIDSEKSGEDAGEILDGIANGIPIFRDLGTALAHAGKAPNYLIFGIAPATGKLSSSERRLLLRAITYGINIVNGLHEFLNDDPEFTDAAKKANVIIRDIRKPRDKKTLRVFNGRISEVTCPRIAVLGTDCAIGKRTTATILTNELNKLGIKAIMVGTGQTGLIQGARYGLALDAIPSQFCAGELEGKIIEAFENENPDVILIEGQGSLSHPAYSTSSFILRGSSPNGVILQHAPARKNRCDFDNMPMPEIDSEIHMIQTFADTKVIGITLNHENMTDEEISNTITNYQQQLDIPVTDALSRPSKKLVDIVLSAFPSLGGSASL